VVITWADEVIKNQWLEVQVLPTSRTGLTSADVFFWGSKVGDVGNPTAVAFTTTAVGDAIAIVAGGLGPAGGITNPRDIDRSNTITAAGDRGAALANVGAITRINIGAGGPFGPAGESGDADNGVVAAVASALALRPFDSATDRPAASPQVQQVELAAAPPATARLADDPANIVPRSRILIARTEPALVDLALDDDLLDWLLNSSWATATP
jgi:hypothetical protein